MALVQYFINLISSLYTWYLLHVQCWSDNFFFSLHGWLQVMKFRSKQICRICLFNKVCVNMYLFQSNHIQAVALNRQTLNLKYESESIILYKEICLICSIRWVNIHIFSFALLCSALFWSVQCRSVLICFVLQYVYCISYNKVPEHGIERTSFSR